MIAIMQSTEHWEECSACKYRQPLLLCVCVCVCEGKGADDGPACSAEDLHRDTRTSGSSLDKHLSTPIGRLIKRPTLSVIRALPYLDGAVHRVQSLLRQLFQGT